MWGKLHVSLLVGGNHCPLAAEAVLQNTFLKTFDDVSGKLVGMLDADVACVILRPRLGWCKLQVGLPE